MRTKDEAALDPIYHVGQGQTTRQSGSPKNPDIKPGMTREEWHKRCEYGLNAEDAFYTPPEKFLFHHYDEPSDTLLICWRPMVGIEKYQVEGTKGGFYGVYDTRDVTYYLKSGTWVMVDSGTFFEDAEIAELERQLAEKKKIREGH